MILALIIFVCSCIDEDDIVVPPVQTALIGENYRLQCSAPFPGTLILWRGNNDQSVSSLLRNVQIEDEDLRFTCLIVDQVTGGTIIFMRRVSIRVVGK